MNRRKLNSAALALCGLGALLIMPPLVLLFNERTRLLGVPAEVIYLFLVWLVLVLGAAWFSARVPEAALREDRPEGEP
ncbi:MAG TPA: hypothetical protein VD858_10870 [Reyranella sp.]|nr:hypothetical protein [Reyranella sp.]